MKKLSLILFSILMIFSMCVSVDAAIDVYGDAVGVLGVKGENNEEIVGSFVGLPNVHVGIRISLVTSDGTDLKNIDYVLKNNQYVSGSFAGGKSKVYYSKNGGLNFENNPITFSTLPNVLKKFIKISYKGETFSGNWVDYAYNMELVENWFSKENYTGSSYEEDLKAVLEYFVSGTIYENNLTEENIKKLFLVVEPTTVVIPIVETDEKGNVTYDKRYYGTAFELASILLEEDAKGQINGTYGKKYLTSFATHLGYNIPCSGYVSGSLYDAMAKKSVYLDGFSKTEYFGVIDINTSICTSSSYRVPGKVGLQEKYLTSEYGIGMGVIWFYDKLNFDKELTCKIVYEKATGTTYDESKPISCEKVEDLVSGFQTAINSDEAFKLEYPKYKNVTEQWYKINCKCDSPKEGYDCTPTTTVNTCGDSSTISVQYSDKYLEEDDWNMCIFNDNGYYEISTHKTSEPRELTYYESGLGNNRYCKVYCGEELTATFDKNVGTVKAGTNFVWPKVANVSGSRTCKTKSINWKQYLEDVKDANQKVLNAYGAYMSAVEKNKVISDITDKYKDDYEGCDCIYNRGKKCCAEGHYVSSLCTQTDQVTGTVTKYSCQKWNCDVQSTRYGYYPKKSYNVNITVPGLETYSDRGTEGGCANSYTPKYANEIQLYNDYIKAQKDAEAVAKSIEACYTWSDSSIYNIADTELKILYNDVIYTYNEELAKNLEKYDSTEYYDCESSPTKVLTCSDTSCSYDITVNVKNCKFYSKTVNASQDFKLKEGTYQYVLKGEGDLSNYSIHFNDLKNYQNVSYMDVGYANLPVSYKMKDDKYNISLTYNKLGHYKSNSFETNVDTILGAVSDDYGTWSCKYNVVSKLIPEETIHSGIDVIYRPIDLKNPFPSINGDGRETGSNWCYNDGTRRDCSNNNQLVTNVINDSIPDEPMYSFTLTPSIIQKIRAYNKDNRYDDFKLTCEASSGKACVSEFITKLIAGEDYGNSEASGTCVTESGARNSNSTDFYNICKVED